jgi:hypothetical protein
MHKDYFGNQVTKMHYVGHFNDNKEMDFTTPQVMCCIICYNNLILNLNSRNQARRRLIIYNMTNGITTLKKHAM